jgi:hypothetical protein
VSAYYATFDTALDTAKQCAFDATIEPAFLSANWCTDRSAYQSAHRSAHDATIGPAIMSTLFAAQWPAVGAT